MQLLEINSNCNILEIGTGSGYQSYILSKLARFVYTVERHRVLVLRTLNLFKKLKITNIFCKHGDGGLGWSEQAPFDRIIVTACAPEIPKNLIGEKGKLLTENLEVTISFYNDNPISVNLPNQVTCKIETTDAALKGQTVSSSYKPAVLENGLSIHVPPFIEAGDNVVIDTRNLEYIKKI